MRHSLLSTRSEHRRYRTRQTRRSVRQHRMHSEQGLAAQCASGKHNSEPREAAWYSCRRHQARSVGRRQALAPSERSELQRRRLLDEEAQSDRDLGNGYAPAWQEGRGRHRHLHGGQGRRHCGRHSGEGHSPNRSRDRQDNRHFFGRGAFSRSGAGIPRHRGRRGRWNGVCRHLQRIRLEGDHHRNATQSTPHRGRRLLGRHHQSLPEAQDRHTCRSHHRERKSGGRQCCAGRRGRRQGADGKSRQSPHGGGPRPQHRGSRARGDWHQIDRRRIHRNG